MRLSGSQLTRWTEYITERSQRCLLRHLETLAVGDAMASGPSSENPTSLLLKEIRGHEVALVELNSLSATRTVYQKMGNLYFRRSIKTAIASEEKQLEAAKAQLEKADYS